MALANILSEMPDLLRRTLDEHTPDAQGYCRECRDASGISAAWPCVTRQVAEEAEHIHGGGLPGTREVAAPQFADDQAPAAAPEQFNVAGRRRARNFSDSGRHHGV